MLLSRAASARPPEAPDESASSPSLAEHSVVRNSHVDPPPNSRTSWTGDRLALLAHLGVGAPAGALGVDLDIAPIRWFAVQVGVGRSSNGAQFALLPRLRVPIDTLGQRTLLTFGAGPSFGHYENGQREAGLGCLLLCALDANGEAPANQVFQRALWYNFELGLDIYSSEGRGFLRTTLGYGFISNASDYSCTTPEGGSYPPGDGCSRDSGQSLAFAMVAYGFDL